MKKDLVIYILIDPRTQEIRWVGQTHNFFNRYKQHLSTKSTNIHLNNWINLLKRNNLKPNYLIIDKLDNSYDLDQSEIFWIKHFRNINCNLINLTNGGKGIRGYKRSNESKIKISNSLLGHKHSEETKNKIRKKRSEQKLKPFTDEQRKKLSIINTGKKHSEETKRKISEIQKGKIQSEESNKKRQKNCQFNIKIIDNFGNEYMSISDASRKLNFDRRHIENILKGIKNNHKGYVFNKV